MTKLGFGARSNGFQSPGGAVPGVPPVGSPVNNTFSGATSFTIPLTPQRIGNAIFINVANFSTVTVSSLSGLGITWAVIQQEASGIFGTALCWGVVTSLTPGNVTVNMSAAGSGAYVAQEFQGTTWVVKGSNVASNSAASIIAPTFTLASPYELHITAGYLTGGTVSSVSSPFSFVPTLSATQTPLVYLSGTTGPQAPTINVTGSAPNVVASAWMGTQGL